MLAVVIASVFMIGVVALQVAPRLGPAERACGTVLAVEVSVRKASGVSASARVLTADGERTVSVPGGAVCRPGDRIELWKRGKRYTSALPGCTRGQVS